MTLMGNGRYLASWLFSRLLAKNEIAIVAMCILCIIKLKGLIQIMHIWII